MSDSFTDSDVDCPVSSTLSIVGGKWTGKIIYQIQDRTVRFNELKRSIPNISQRMLTKQLRDLEDAQIVQRKVYAEIPPRVEYSLTELGLTLRPVFKVLKAWGISYRQKMDEERNQDRC